jgi:hypothetical protein
MSCCPAEIAASRMGAGFGTVRDARDFCRLADCFDGMAAAGHRVGGRKHHHYPDLSGWNQRIQPHHSFGIRHQGFSGGHSIDFPGNLYHSVYFPPLLGNVIAGLALVAALGSCAGGRRGGEAGEGKGLAKLSAG